jgi:CMP-2-keto-3-deoxyoctulosonic acid synthetase
MSDLTPEVLIVVPARFASTRFPGKPLALLGGKPLVQWTWEAAMRAADLGEVVVATEDTRIAEVVRGFGGTAVMTSAEARNGTERCAEVAALRPGTKLVVNLQGDSPLVRRSDIAALVNAWRETGAAMLTPFLACDAQTEARLLADAAAGRVGGTTAVADRAGNALYFSKRVLPHGRAEAAYRALCLYARRARRLCELGTRCARDSRGAGAAALPREWNADPAGRSAGARDRLLGSQQSRGCRAGGLSAGRVIRAGRN